MEHLKDEPYIDCAVLIVEYAFANGALSRYVAWTRPHLLWDDASVRQAPPSHPNVSEQPRSPSPAVVSQTSNVAGPSTATTSPIRQYHFHTYYIKERPSELVETTDEELEDEENDACNAILPMEVENYRFPPQPFQR
ncbi:uncharacterized protein ATC70_004993 [Mucor velutinosus]|uniref:Uncharacterized protein n=1 Tax=Mucor velutinosus TaxID=708070 RepID=A0AAN7HXE8_9FUNG|nr:hypothetical protein ATC70_004993 [Mucor velutinosus]